MYRGQLMRKTVKFDRVVHFMTPVWHQAPVGTSSKNQLKYSRPMVITELVPGIEYKCEELQSLINRGAVIPDEEYKYVCSHGFIPTSPNMPSLLISDVTTGMDPKEELH